MVSCPYSDLQRRLANAAVPWEPAGEPAGAGHDAESAAVKAKAEMQRWSQHRIRALAKGTCWGVMCWYVPAVIAKLLPCK